MASRSFGSSRDTIEREIRQRVRQVIEQVVEEELEAALGAKPSQRVGEQRRGYRHGYRDRTLTTSTGATKFRMPRGRLLVDGGGSQEWESRTVARYERRSRRVDEAIVGMYLSGANTRRIRGALAPLLKGAPLSKDAVVLLMYGLLCTGQHPAAPHGGMEGSAEHAPVGRDGRGRVKSIETMREETMNTLNRSSIVAYSASLRVVFRGDRGETRRLAIKGWWRWSAVTSHFPLFHHLTDTTCR